MCVARTFSEPLDQAGVQGAPVWGAPSPADWHALDAARVVTQLGSNASTGLTTLEVNQRRLRYGRNSLQEVKPRPAWRLLVDQFASIVIALLAVAAAVAWITGDVLEAIAILVVLVINALVGFATEWKASRALDALRRQARTTTRVRREGFESPIDAEDLVPGDIIILNAGDRVPADARLLEASRLQTEESALTGESTTADKNFAPVSVSTLLAERRSMLFLGTAVAAGRAVALVVGTGTNTELGRIGRLVATAIKERSPLEKQLSNLGSRLVYIVLAIAAVVMITGWLRGDGLWMMVEVGISLAVAAVPEGLPAVTTLILALGVLRMARQQAIMRRLSAVETLGSTTVICADKTGEVVAVTGDGVNDAPALKRANIGIAMGQRGTEVAKEAADVVLADDNFATIVRALEGGRTIYANITKFVHMMFSHNLGEVLMIFTAIAAGWALPLLPLQILWMNLVSDVFPALALAVEPASPEIMKQRPRDPERPLLSSRLAILIAWQAAMLGAVALAAYMWALQLYGPGAHSRTIALFAIIGAQLGHMFNCRSRTRSAFDGLFRNPFIWIAVVIVICLQLLAVYVPPLARVLGTVRPSETDWLVIGACAIAPVLIVEATKAVTRWKTVPRYEMSTK